jgi:hypothetical protein
LVFPEVSGQKRGASSQDESAQKGSPTTKHAKETARMSITDKSDPPEVTWLKNLKLCGKEAWKKCIKKYTNEHHPGKVRSGTITIITIKDL